VRQDVSSIAAEELASEDGFDNDDGGDAPGTRFIAKATPRTAANDTAQITKGSAGETACLPLRLGGNYLIER